ncbi:hypothetical protein [Calothrix sp. UHCC 0171]|nr:hypothetical protein [Calothrix sp. UHCC 0171]MEA5569565.1 hypothetical protein [Calothrix sp. UHCC 0171]
MPHHIHCFYGGKETILQNKVTDADARTHRWREGHGDLFDVLPDFGETI